MNPEGWLSFYITMAILFILFAIFIPIVMKDRMRFSFMDKTKLDKDNINLWGKFPGDLKTELNHNFKFFDYSQSKNSLSLINSSIIINESIDYNITSTDQNNDHINIYSKKNYELKNDSKIDNINSISMGIFELLETLSNTPEYQKVSNSMKYLFEKIIGNEEVFNKKLYAINSHKTLDEKTLKEIFKKIKSEDVKDKLYKDEIYGFNKLSGYYRWVILINNSSLYNNVLWIKDTFDLSNEEIESILGKENYLNQEYEKFKKSLIDIFKCPSTGCGDLLIYYQLINRKISQKFDIENINKLNYLIDPFLENDIKYEMDEYFENEFKDKKYEDYSINETILEKILKGSNSLYNPSNTISLLNNNKTKNFEEIKKKYSISESQSKFIIKYFFDYLPSIFSKITIKNETIEINKNSRAFSSFLQIIVDNSFGKLIKNSNLLSILRSQIIYAKIKKDQNESENLCEELFQKTLDDGRRVLKICSNSKFNLSNIEVVNEWVKPYKCSLTGKYEDCNMTIFNELNKVIYFSYEDLKKFYSNDTFGYYIQYTNNIIKEHYKCKDQCTDYYLAKLQYTTCGVTNNPPDIIKDKKSDSIKNWDSSFDVEVELKFYQKNCSDEDCNEISNGAVMSLYNTTKYILNSENNDAYNNRILIDGIFSLYSKKEYQSEFGKKLNIKNSQTFIDSFRDMIKTQILKGNLYQKYKPLNIIFGNNDEDKLYIQILSNGDFSDNFKPNKEKTTGFNFYNITQNEILDFDNIQIETKNNKDNDKQILRRIVKINNSTYFNIKKEEYNPLSNKTIEIDAPLYNSFDISNNTDIWFSDGFQYDSKLDKIYYYDELSSRILQFDYEKKKEYNSINCKKYILNNKNISLNLNEKEEIDFKLNESFGLISQRFNKPFVISSIDNEKIKDKIKIDDITNKESYFCIDEYTNMVLESNLNLIYSIYSKEFGNIVSMIENNEIYPFILYNRNYLVNIESYNKIFSESDSFKNWRLFVIIFSLVCALVFICLAVYYGYILKYKYNIPVDSNEKIIPDIIDDGNNE